MTREISEHSSARGEVCSIIALCPVKRDGRKVKIRENWGLDFHWDVSSSFFSFFVSSLEEDFEFQFSNDGQFGNL